MVELPMVPDWLVGLWRRESIELQNGTLDRTTRAFWGQTLNLFVDIRVPEDRPSGSGSPGFKGFTLDELAQLSEQQGFAGHIEVKGDTCTWISFIDYQPNTGRPDTGHVRLDGDVLHEQGGAGSVIGMDYHEIYRHEVRGKDRRIALRLESCGGHLFGGRPQSEAILVILDDRFMFARGRGCQLEPAETLRELVQKTGGDRAPIEAYLDCEVSIGCLGIDDQSWRIELSTLPWREGQRLFTRGQGCIEPKHNLLRMDTPSGWARWRVFDTNLPHEMVCELLSA